jgi:predicted transcriptional regulator
MRRGPATGTILMPRPRNQQPTDGELEILKVLWSHGPCELGVVCGELRQRREVATTTVATMLKVMLDKGLVRRARGRGRSYRWSAAVSSTATRRGMLDKLLSSAFDGSARGLVTQLVEEGDLSAEDRDAIRRLLDDGGDRDDRDDPSQEERDA